MRKTYSLQGRIRYLGGEKRIGGEDFLRIHSDYIEGQKKSKNEQVDVQLLFCVTF